MNESNNNYAALYYGVSHALYPSFIAIARFASRRVLPCRIVEPAFVVTRAASFLASKYFRVGVLAHVEVVKLRYTTHAFFATLVMCRQLTRLELN